MPQLPIPGDWNGTDWTCIQVQWPDSTEYLAVLAGFLSYLTRGRAYDAGTGDIKDAQAIGWEIFRRNMPYRACSEDTPTPETPSTGDLPCDWCYEGVEPCGEDEMSCCIDDLKWIDGVLWYHQCNKWYEVDGGVGVPSLPEDGDSIIEPETPEQEADFACAKAKVIGDMIWLVADSLLAHGEDADIYNIVRAVEEDTGLDLVDVNVFITVATWSLVDLAIDMQDILTEGNKQELICRLALVLDGSNNDIGQNQFDLIAKTCLQVAGGNILARVFLTNVVACIGLQEFRKYTRLAVLTTQDCDCPGVEAPIIPEGYTWAHYYDFTLDDYGWLATGSDALYVLGDGFTANVDAYGDTIAGCLKAASIPLADTRLTFWRIQYGDWPISDTNSGFWVKVVPNALNSDMSVYGHQFISGVTNTAIGQGIVAEFANVQCYENPVIGGPASMVGLWIAGTGDDPYPGDPPYTP